MAKYPMPLSRCLRERAAIALLQAQEAEYVKKFNAAADRLFPGWEGKNSQPPPMPANKLDLRKVAKLT